jgi:hypothetical protein
MKALRIYSGLFVVAIYLGESFVLMTRDKPILLAIDDYLAATVMLALIWKPLSQTRLAGLCACWAFFLGNLYVMTFYRFDPAVGGGKNTTLLVAALVASLVGVAASAYCLYKNNQETTS